MTPVARIAVLLVSSPAGMFAGHVIAYRGLRSAGRRPNAHTSAFAGIAICFVALVLAAAALTWEAVSGSFATAAAFAIYIAGTYGALSVLYLDIVNIAETSLHMHLLLEVAWNDRQPLERLIDKYSPAHMIGERLDRLTAMGQVRRDGDCYVLGDRSALGLGKAVDLWRRVLGMPTSPVEQ
jgi:hypothetical protein